MAPHRGSCQIAIKPLGCSPHDVVSLIDNGDHSWLQITPCMVNVHLMIHSLAPPHSITSSARCRNASGMTRASVVAVFRFITNSYLVGFWTGRSAVSHLLECDPY